jgi:hypothetical protein
MNILWVKKHKKTYASLIAVTFLGVAFAQTPAPAPEVAQPAAPAPAPAVAPVVEAPPAAPANEAPSVSGIPSFSIEEGGTFESIKLDDYVIDNDDKNNQINWSVTGNQQLVITISGARVATIKTPNKLWNGSETVTFTATDSKGGKGQETITLTVNSVNNEPKLNKIPGQNISEGQTFSTIKLDDFVEDEDHPDEQILWAFDVQTKGKTASDQTPEIKMDGNRVATLVLPDTNWYGETEVTFTATDPEGASVSTKSSFNVRSINDLPIILNIPSQKIKEGETFTSINLDDLVSDADHDKSSLKWSVTGGSKLKVKISGSEAEILIPDENFNGPAETFTFTVTDPENGKSSKQASFEVTSVNDLPEIKDIPSQTIDEGKTFQAIKLDNFVTDVDHKLTDLKWTVTGNKALKINIDGSRNAAILTPDENWHGEETLTFTVTDPENGSAKTTATFTVNSVNDLPVVTAIPPQNIDEGKKFATIKLDDFVADVDHKDDQISWEYSVKHQGKEPESGTLDVKIENRIASILIPDTNWNGAAEITFTASDPEGGTASTKTLFTVKSINDLPIVKKIPEQSIQEKSEFNDINLDDYVSDADHDISKLNWSVEGGKDIKITIGKDRVAKIKTPNINWNGPTEKFKLTVTDPEGGSASTDLSLTVKSVNDIPEVKQIADQRIKEGGKFSDIKLDDFVADIDHDDSKIKWTITGNKDLKIKIDGSRVASIETPNENWHGEESLTFTATDPEGGTANVSANFVVESVNDLPIITGLKGQTLKEGQKFVQIKLDDLVQDADHKATEITWETKSIVKNAKKGQSSELQVNIDANRVATILAPDTNWYGAESITFTATDPDGGKATASADFEVTSVNDLPVIKKIPDQSIDEGAEFSEINLNDHVSDVDHSNDKLKWEVSGTKELVISIDAKKAIAKIKIPNKYWNGAEKVTFAVSDPEGGKASQVVTLNVKSINNIPVLTELKPQTIKEGEQFKEIDLNEMVSDADHSDDKIKWTFSGNKDIQVKVSSGKALLTVPNKDWHGAETINFTATDPEGGAASTSALFTVSSVNDLPEIKKIPGQSIKEGEQFKTIKLDDFISDADHKNEQLTWSFKVEEMGAAPVKGKKVEAKPGLNVQIDGNRIATIVAPEKQWNGRSKITFTATDPEGGQTTTESEFTVVSVNDLPTINPAIAFLSIKEGEEFPALNLNDVVKDADHTPTQLSWTITGAKELVATIDKNNVLTFKAPNKDWYGRESMTLTVTDPDNGKATQKLEREITSVNDDPVIAGLKGQTIKEGEKFAPIELDKIVSDVDHKASDLKWRVTGAQKLKVAIDANRIATITAPDENWNGPAETLTFEVADPEKGNTQASAVFEVQSVNDAPVLVKELKGEKIKEGGKFATIKLDEYIKDVDHTPAEIQWSVKVIGAPVAKGKNAKVEPDLSVAIDPSRIATINIPDKQWYGKRTITFTATDPEKAKVDLTADFEVEFVNDLPVIKDIPEQVINEGESFKTLNLNELVSDADHANSEIKWSITGAKDLKVNMDTKKGSLEVKTPDKDYFGTETLTLEAVDPVGGKATKKVVFKVNPVNDAPVLKPIKDMTTNEGVLFPPIDLKELVSDVDNKPAELKWSATGNKDLKVSFEGPQAKIIIPHKHWSGPTEKITFTVTDPAGASASHTASFTVKSVNDAPVVSAIPPQSINEKEQFKTIKLDDYVKDMDHKVEEMTWVIDDQNIPVAKGQKGKPASVASKNKLKVTIDDKRIATVHIPDKYWNGAETIKFAAYDPEGANHHVLVKFSVKSINDLPVVSGVEEQMVDEGKAFASLKLDDLVNDPDHTPAQMKWSVSGNRHIDVKIGANRVATIAPARKDWHGSERITFEVSDPDGGKAKFSANFKVRRVNKAPELKKIPDQTTNEDVPFEPIKIDQYVEDKDHQKSELKWEITGNKSLIVDINYVKREIYVKQPRPDWNGPAETFTFKVTDPEGASATTSATFTVRPVNDAPIALSHAFNTLEGDELKVSVTRGVLHNATDPDGDKPKNAAVVKSTSNGKLDFNPDGSFSYMPKPGFYGLDEFTFVAKDKEGLASKPERVEINVQFRMKDVRANETKPETKEDDKPSDKRRKKK